MVIRLYSGGLEGVDAFPVEVEVDYVRQGLPGFSLVGLAETEVREARDRVFAALRACNFGCPRRGSRSTWPRPDGARPEPATICRWLWACWPPPV